MKLHRIFIHNKSRARDSSTRLQRGFTLVELLVVIGIVAVVSGFALIMGLDSYRSSSFHGNRDVLVAALMHARAQAINNICIGGASICHDGKPHGVAIRPAEHPDKYVLFQGVSYTARDAGVDEVLNANIHYSYTGATEVVFTQFSATTSTAVTITISDSMRSSAITIGTEGQITWTN